MSATKIAASFRTSLTALEARSPGAAISSGYSEAWAVLRTNIVLLRRAWLHFHAALRRTWKQEVQVLRVDWPVYPRRFKHNTIFAGGKQAGVGES